jgi:hypothetical protein
MRCNADASEWPFEMHRIATWLGAALLSLLFTGCVSVPSLEARSVTSAFADTGATRLGRAIAPRAAANPDKTGIHAIPDAREAFAARVPSRDSQLSVDPADRVDALGS